MASSRSHGRLFSPTYRFEPPYSFGLSSGEEAYADPLNCRRFGLLGGRCVFCAWRQPSTYKAAFWGIHLTGVNRPFCSPWAVCGRPCQTRRMPASTRPSGRDFPRPTGRDQVVVAHGDMGHGEFEDSEEHHPPAPGVPSVEAKHELVEVARQVGRLHCAVVRAEQPPLGQRNDLMHRGKQKVGILPPGAGCSLAAPLVGVAQPRQAL